MKLYIARHGDSLPKEINTESPLSKKGEQEINNLAHFLRHLKPSIQGIFHSGKRRAQQTAEILAKAFDNQGEIKARTGMDPLDSIFPLLDDLKTEPQTVLLVGHLPFMETLISMMCTGSLDHKILSLSAGTLVCMDKSESDTFWSIQWMINPQLCWDQSRTIDKSIQDTSIDD